MVKIKLSLGSAMSLNLIKGKLNIPFTTLYLMVGNECISNCSFCTQSKDARMREKLSRVTWYEYNENEIIDAIDGKKYSRICFQTLDYPEVMEDLLKILPEFYKLNIPISVSIAPPLNGNLKSISEYVDTISIALDASNADLFDKVKGKERGNRFTWEGHWKNLLEAKNYFKNVNTHLIVGLGESDEDIIKTMINLKNFGISTALFSYTPALGKGSYPPIERYRKIQISRCLIYDYKAEFEDFIFNEKHELTKIKSEYLKNVMDDAKCFMTSGCPGCNRPFYNEEPRKIYNYPYLPNREELKKIKNEVKIK